MKDACKTKNKPTTEAMVEFAWKQGNLMVFTAEQAYNTVKLTMPKVPENSSHAIFSQLEQAGLMEVVGRLYGTQSNVYRPSIKWTLDSQGVRNGLKALNRVAASRRLAPHISQLVVVSEERKKRKVAHVGA